MSPELTSDELQRYSRHVLLPEVGIAGQIKLKAAKVLIVGAGGLGSPVALYLAAAGVGKIGIVDSDLIDITNLQRQILHDSHAIGQSKTASAYQRLQSLNPEITVIEHSVRLTTENVTSLVGDYDLTVDASDNFATRYLLNDSCVLNKKPLVHGAIYRFEGQASVFALPGGPCYRCLFPQEPQADAVPNCADAGVFGALAGVIGSIQATEVLKLILSLGDSLAGRLLIFDALGLEFNVLSITKDPLCPACGDNPLIKTISDNAAYRNHCAKENSRDALDTANLGASAIDSHSESLTVTSEIDAFELESLLKQGQSPILIDVRNKEELQFCKLANSINIPLPD
ncbi:MAG: molybdopterin-synthase adenylyltransferase MoeB, partial [Candidatus Obscuribacterales bacterium]|nr:molybdopterin-synthase adenylyltransferase MoeB [Candidatus Obscuribacterales bacterium]